MCDSDKKNVWTLLLSIYYSINIMCSYYLNSYIYISYLRQQVNILSAGGKSLDDTGWQH